MKWGKRKEEKGKRGGKNILTNIKFILTRLAYHILEHPLQNTLDSEASVR